MIPFKFLVNNVDHDTTSIPVVELWYPDRDQQQAIEVGMVDVRSADNIRICYDFIRDGWMIKQDAAPSKASDPRTWEVNRLAENWQEVAFIQAWALQQDPATND